MSTHILWVERQLERWQDAPDLVPIGTLNPSIVHTMPVPDLSTPVHDLTVDQLRDRVRYMEMEYVKTSTYTEELVRMRTHPHLYDEWQISLTVDLAQIEREHWLTENGLIEWECDCGTVQVCKPDEHGWRTTPCYVCG